MKELKIIYSQSVRPKEPVIETVKRWENLTLSSMAGQEINGKLIIKEVPVYIGRKIG